MDYEELAVEIVPTRDGGFEVRARSSCYGSGAAPFSLSLDPDALEWFLSGLVSRGRNTTPLDPPPDIPNCQATPSRAPVALPPDPKAAGEVLFASVFSGSVRSVFDRTFGRVEGTRDGEGRPRGLRVRFLFGTEDADLTPLGVVPWELLRRPDTRSFLAQDRRTPVVRCLEVPRPVRPVELVGPFRLLLVESAPWGVEPLDLPEERGRIREALESAGPGMEVRRLPCAELGSLREALLEEEVHALHFMGHGDLTPEGEGVLYFETESGAAQAVPAGTLAAHLTGIESLRVVVLNACSSGALPRVHGRDPFTATAASLVMAGVPAVVAMQFPVSDRAAIAFSEALYRRLAACDPVEAAVAEGRLRIIAREPESLEWVTPVLYLYGPSGQLLVPGRGRGVARRPGVGPEPGGDTRPTAASGQEPSQRPTAETTGGMDQEGHPSAGAPTLRLGIRSLVGLGHGLEAEADRVLDLTRHFEGRRIRDEGAWSGAILPELRGFLAGAREHGGPVILDLAAHHSVAFLAGAVLESKAGVELTVVQRGQTGRDDWFPSRPGQVEDGPLWREEEDLPADSDALDVAVALSVTHQVLPQVRAYLKRTSRAVARIIPATIHPEPWNTSVRDGAHALRLAQTLSRRIRARPIEERRGTVRLFAAAPNALLVFLGQLAPSLGRVQIYEYDMAADEEAPYWPGGRWGKSP